MRLINDVDQNQTKRIFEVLREETPIFKGLSYEEVQSLTTVFKVLNFKKYDNQLSLSTRIKLE